MPTTLEEDEVSALRELIVRVWTARAVLSLSGHEEDAVLISLMAVGTPEEGQAAAELLHARRAAMAAQQKLESVPGLTAAATSPRRSRGEP